MSAPVLMQRWDGARCVLTLNRPEQGNALSRELVDALDVALDDCARRHAERAIDCVVIQGAGRHFCAGFDLSGLADETDDSLLARFTRIELLLQRVARAPFPIIAVAHGRVMGAGADLFAACAQRLAVRGASFAFPGARGFGLVLGSRRLAARVGAARARGWIESACVIGAAEAATAGLASALVETAPEDVLALVTTPSATPATTSATPAATPAATPTATPTATAVATPSSIAGVAASRDALLDGAIDGNAELDDARDLAALVRSAARAGLRQRVADYVESQVRQRRA